MQDALKKEELTKGPEARQMLQFELMAGPQLDDTLAALAFLTRLRGVDAHRIAVIGHSFGGPLTLLDAEREKSVRAALTFGAAANSWATSLELRQRLLAAVDNIAVPVMLIHAVNDYDTAPGRQLDEERQRLHRVHVLKMYPAVGKTPDEGHNLVYLAIPIWEADVFQFPGAKPQALS